MMVTLRVLLVALLVWLRPEMTQAADEVKMDDTTKKATAKALEWLARTQDDDGSWSEPRYPANTAITAFALLAFMSQGHLPNKGQYAPEVQRGIKFLIQSARQGDSYLIGPRGGNMYCHAMATLALAEAYGMTQDEELKPVLEKAVKLIKESQSDLGGWRYEPVPTGSDISVTIMQVMALRAAKNAGLHVPNVTIKKAIDYINRCHHEPTGGYTYQPGSRTPHFARTAAGVCVLQLTGEYEAKVIGPAVEYMKQNFNSRSHFFYGHYYAAHAMHQVGGREWADWYHKIKELLLSKQSPAGDWGGSGLDGSTPGPVFETSVSVIILSIPAHYLPIFQR